MMNKEFERMQRLNMLKSMCFQDSALYCWTFENDNGRNPLISKAKTYADKWSDMMSKNIGLLLWGEVGTGKTFFAACIANALVENCVSVKMTNFSTILNDLFYENDKNQYIDRLNNHSLLIIDDLGIERDTEYALEQVYNIIDARYKSNKPLIVTTNLTITEIKNPVDTAHKRIYDRVLEMCVPVKFDGENFRTQKADFKMEFAKNLFNTEE
ncbi:MAG: ATP-binding protein [Clostridia bacterium]|nr:ATP-binding protein [Clostridia bacterium]